eukprot:COSAG05_NODE_2246_length_3345_cov_5.452671_2_plen_52_part_00
MGNASREAEAALHKLNERVCGLQESVQQARARRLGRSPKEQPGLSPGTARC